jgi:alkanesulfonate monooxygenase SsuD/methylene tetrahydromethanopterin reductase-like flavin-dependent oxidoreductase (luciferase family)
VPGEINLWEEYLAYRDTPEGQKARVGGLIGSPETIAERLRKFETSNVDQVILLNQSGKNRHEDISDSLELFAREVMPEFHEREDEHQEWKQAVLAGEIDLEEIDTTPYAVARRRP